mgnify:FL=1
MTLVFALITYLGTVKIDTSYFYDVDACQYFAKRINQNVSVPLPENKSKRYTAVCEPRTVDIKRTRVY